jgi:membrane protease YdiL (CAAX protease family)
MYRLIGIIFLLIGTLVLTLLTVLFLKCLKVDIKDIEERTNPKMLVTAIVSNFLFIGFVYILIRFYNHQQFANLGFSFTIIDVVFSIIGFCLTFAISYFFVKYLKKTNKITISKEKRYFSKYSFPSTFVALLTLFLAAFQEEVTFRGYFSISLSNLRFLTVLLISSILFTVWHFITSKVNIFQVLDWFIGGVSLYFAYSLSGSLWVASIFHFARNVSNALILNIANSHSIYTFDKPIPAKHKTISTLIMSIMWIGLTFIFYTNF